MMLPSSRSVSTTVSLGALCADNESLLAEFAVQREIVLRMAAPCVPCNARFCAGFGGSLFSSRLLAVQGEEVGFLIFLFCSLCKFDTARVCAAEMLKENVESCLRVVEIVPWHDVAICWLSFTLSLFCSTHGV